MHKANESEQSGAKELFLKSADMFENLQLVWADQGYQGPFEDWVKEYTWWDLEIVRKREGQVGFEVQPRRWVVERTFAWLGRYRRLGKEYEQLSESTEAMIYLAMTKLMLNRITSSKHPYIRWLLSIKLIFDARNE